jgi:hypothetical protein
MACSLINIGPNIGPGVSGSGNLKTETRPVSGFDRVAFSGVGQLSITQGEAESLEVEADDNLLQYLKTEVQDGTLTISISDAPTGGIRPTQEIHYTLVVKELTYLEVSGAGSAELGDLTTTDLVVDASGAGNIRFGKVTATSLDVTASGAGSVRIADLQSELFAVELSGAGNMEVAGKVDRLKLEISGAGSIKAGDLEAIEANIDMSGAGKATLWVTLRLDAVMSGVGNLEYYGSPELIFDDTGVGDVKTLGEK